MKYMKYFLCKKLKMIRKEHGLSQKKLAKAIDISESTIKNWEKGKDKPSEEYVDKLTSFFNVPREYFVEPFYGIESTKGYHLMDYFEGNEEETIDITFERLKAFYLDCDDSAKKDELRKVLDSALRVAKDSDASMLTYIDRILIFCYNSLEKLAEMRQENNKNYKADSDTFYKALADIRKVFKNAENNMFFSERPSRKTVLMITIRRKLILLKNMVRSRWRKLF